MKNIKLERIVCEGCGGDLKFSAKTQRMVCEKCGTEIPFQKQHLSKKHPVVDLQLSLEKSNNNWEKENVLMGCPNCGAKLIHTAKELSVKCPYCGTALTTSKKEILGMCPDEIIPFAFDEETASKKFIEEVKHKKFLPETFKKQLPKNKITGIYIPSFVFDAVTTTRYNGVIEKTVTKTDSDGHMCSHSVYKNISGEKSYKHSNICLEISSHVNQNEMESIIPYNEEKAFDYDERFIKGYTVEQYNEEIENSYTKYHEMLDKKIRNSILSGYDYTRVVKLDLQTNYQEELFVYRIVPVYIFEYTFKGKPYRTIMNGDNGKIGSGLPVSKLKKTMVLLIPILIIILISLLIFLFGN